MNVDYDIQFLRELSPYLEKKFDDIDDLVKKSTDEKIQQVFGKFSEGLLDWLINNYPTKPHTKSLLTQEKKRRSLKSEKILVITFPPTRFELWWDRQSFIKQFMVLAITSISLASLLIKFGPERKYKE